MTRPFFLAALAMLCLSTSATEKPEKAWHYADAHELRIINKGFDNAEAPYHRLPANLVDSLRPELWKQQKCSSGFGVRFATNSSRIGARYQLLWNAHMSHMADTGLKGSDLYVWQGDSVWRHLCTIKPNVKDKEAKIVEAVYASNLDTTKVQEYMVYMPLYDGTEKFEIKVDEGASLTSGNPGLIDRNKKIVSYGSSIMQGGCASRTGMSSTNIMSRELNCEIVNLGFSGQGKLDYPVARAMAAIPDVDIYVVDAVPNCDVEMCENLTYDFVNIIRRANPHTPIVMVEGPIYTFAWQDAAFMDFQRKKNEAYRRNYEKLKAENPDNIYYIDSVNLDGMENDGTVDGTHLTDLGFRHYADKVAPLLREILNKK